jgi:hypothetical protein
MMGGQDQGLYTNYSEVMLKHGGLNFVDEFRKELPDSLRTIYDSYRMSSVPMIDPEKSLMTVDFYPLHPMWMAVFGWILGEDLKTLSLLFFSLLYVWTGKLLTNEIFNSERAGYISAILLAINPALVFFSKYPVSEMVGLAFSFCGFLYLIRGIKSKVKKIKTIYLSLAVLCFVSFFFVRMQFLMYLPFFSILVLGLTLHDRQAHWRSGAIPILGTIIIFFMFSLIWYFGFQNSLFSAMFGGHFRERYINFVSPNLLFGVVGALLLMLTSVVFLRKRFSSAFNLGVLSIWFSALSGRLLIIALSLSTVSLFSLYKTGAMTPFPWVVDTNDLLIFRYHALYRFVLFVSPFAFIALVYGLFENKLKSGFPALLLLFIATSWMVVLIQPWIPYLYYYGRYLAGEVLPYTLIAVSGILSIWMSKEKRSLAYSVLILTCGFYIFFLIPQFRTIESEPRNMFKEFAEKIDTNDIVLAVEVDDRMLVPLRLSYNKSIFPIKKWDSSTQFITSDLRLMQLIAIDRGGRLLLLVPAEIPIRFGNYLGGARFDNSFITNSEHIREGVMQSSLFWQKMLLPFVSARNSSIWLFYDITNVDLKTLPHGGFCPEVIDFSSNGNILTSGIQLSGFSHSEKNGRWTEGAIASVECKPIRQYSTVTINVVPYIPAKGFSQIVDLSINGDLHAEYNLMQDSHITNFTIPIIKEYNDKIKIDFWLKNAVSPQEFNESSDSRKLGIYIKSINFN